MLEIRNLTKIYRPKKGVPVEALSQVSLSFPDTGMVFLLGKSGSGKSTLLNLIGGLDRCDEGDIFIAGNSTRTFRQGDFDSYRNTFVGFIFQEYNVLEEFTVGANIALALELQGKKATDEEVSSILDQVDLAGYGARRPNELSGGQKQRVAIARALVKNPKIIMADEPTGALDSVTGRAVLDTLKKLSAEKLVIVVSHDRDFAEQYADRIIELADGKVISDREFVSDEEPSAAAPRFEDNAVVLPRGYHLTEEDREAINRYMDALAAGDLTLASAGVSASRKSREASAAAPRQKETLALIRSRLPLRAAFRIGCGALKHKKFRLVVTILLSCIAFGLFGLADTFGSYDHVTTSVTSIIDSDIQYVSILREDKIVTGDGEKDFYWRQMPGSISEEDLKEIQAGTGLSVRGVFVPPSGDVDFVTQFDNSREFTQTDFHIYAYGLSGFARINQADLEGGNCTLKAGRLPLKDGEIAITAYLCETFYIGGYRAPDAAENTPYDTVKNPGDMLGKVLRLAGRDYTVVGVVDTKMDLDRYRPLTVKSEEDPSAAEILVNYALYSELSGLRNYSFAQVGFLSEDALDAMVDKFPTLRGADSGWAEFLYPVEGSGEGDPDVMWGELVGRLSDRGGAEIRWLDGAKTALGEKEVILSEDCLSELILTTGLSLNEVYDADGSYNWKALKESLRKLDLTLNLYLYNGGDRLEEAGWRIVGVLLPGETLSGNTLGRAFLLPDEVYGKLVSRGDGRFAFAAGDMPADRGEIRRLVSFCEDGAGDHRYTLQNPVTYELSVVHEVLVVLARVFFWIGLGFAVFAAVMLANFIATSIHYKKQDIGILRAIGARGNDVFRIFFSESFVIAMINFVLSGAGVFAATAIINAFIRNRGRVLITVLTFGPRQILLILGLSLLVAALASFLPVKRIAKKRPIDAIRNR